MGDDDGEGKGQGLPIAIGPVKLNLQIQNIENLRAVWEKYCVPISKAFWPLIKGELDVALQKQLLRKLQNVAKVEKMMQEIMAAGGKTPEEVSPSIAEPLIAAAAEEEREELLKLWAKLLAAASDPTRKNRVRLSFVATLKQMDPLDAKVLDALCNAYPAGFGQNQSGRDVLSTQFNVSIDEVLVSFSNLERLNCVGFSPGDGPKISPMISPAGRLLVEALR